MRNVRLIERIDNMSLYRKLSKEDRSRLRNIFSEEHKFLLKRPQYIIGNIIIAALIFYSIFKGLGYKVGQLTHVADVISVIAGLAAALLVVWSLNKWLKFFKNIILFMAIWGIWMLVWTLLIHTHSGPKLFKLEYLLYAILIFVGWQCSCGSIKEHLSEKIFMSQK